MLMAQQEAIVDMVFLCPETLVVYRVIFGPRKFTLRDLNSSLIGPLWREAAFKNTYGVRNLEMTIRFSLKSRPSERFHRPEMSQIKAEIHLR